MKWFVNFVTFDSIYSRACIQLIFVTALMRVLIFLVVRYRVINVHFLCVYLSGRCQPTTVWPSMLMLNVGVAY